MTETVQQIVKLILSCTVEVKVGEVKDASGSGM